MPNPTHTHASSDTLLVSMALGRWAEVADAGEASAAASPWGAFMFAAGGRRTRENMVELVTLFVSQSTSIFNCSLDTSHFCLLSTFRQVILDSSFSVCQF